MVYNWLALLINLDGRLSMVYNKNCFISECICQEDVPRLFSSEGEGNKDKIYV